MKNKKSNKKTMALMSLAMVISLPIITSHAAEEATDEKPLIVQNDIEEKTTEEKLTEATSEEETTGEESVEAEANEESSSKAEANEEAVADKEVNEASLDLEQATSEDEKSEEADKTSSEEKAEEKFTLSQAQKQSLEEAGFTDSEIANIESSIDNSLKENKEFDVDGFINEKISSKKAEDKEAADKKVDEKDAKEFSKVLMNYAAVAAEEEVSDDSISDINITISGNEYENARIIKPVATAKEMKDNGTEDNILRTHIDFKIPEGTKSGNYFDVKLSDNVNLNGVVENAEIDPLMYNGIAIADVEHIDKNRSLRYTFNNIIDNLKDINVSIDLPLFIDRQAVPNNSKQTVSVDVTGADAPTTEEFDVVYDQKDFAEKSEGNTISGRADIDQVTDNTYR